MPGIHKEISGSAIRDMHRGLSAVGSRLHLFRQDFQVHHAVEHGHRLTVLDHRHKAAEDQAVLVPDVHAASGNMPSQGRLRFKGQYAPVSRTGSPGSMTRSPGSSRAGNRMA